MNDILKTDLVPFIKKSFETINYGQEFLSNWHINLIAEHLKAIKNGEIKRLIINIPPRYLKSICVSVAFPTWILGNEPHKRIIVASYSHFLSVKHQADCRFIIDSQWYKDTFIDFKLLANEKKKFTTTQNGFRLAVSVNGGLTGEGGDILIVDDPHNPLYLSKSYRERAINWYTSVFSSRLNNKKNGAIIIVMQRLHEEDLTGYLLAKKNKWEVLNIPIRAENDTLYKIGNFEKLYKGGEILHNEREGELEIEELKNDMGSYVFSAQYMQKPISTNCEIIKKHWMKYYENQLIDKAMTRDFLNFLSFDTAIKTHEKNDYSCCTIWQEREKNKIYLLEVIRKKLEFPDLLKLAIDLINKWHPNAVLIEDKASGQSLIQQLKKEGKLNIIAIKVIKDKVNRVSSITPLFESGTVFLPKEADWLADYEDELFVFPNGKHDDQVDSTSQFLEWWRNRSEKKETFLKIRRL